MVGAALTEPVSGWVLSVVAGYSIESLQKVFKTEKVIRTMPNTPAIVLEGMTVWTAPPSCPPDIMKTARNLLGSMGEELFVVDESYIDMATAISGSGPAVSTQRLPP
jgi:pyrroline-5-carboxylate reductase